MVAKCDHLKTIAVKRNFDGFPEDFMFQLSQKELAQKFKELESKFEGHDEKIRDIIEAINQLLLSPEKPKRQIGFQVKEPKQKYSSGKK